MRRRLRLACFLMAGTIAGCAGVAVQSPVPTGSTVAPTATLESSTQPTSVAVGPTLAPAEFWMRSVSGDPGAVDYGSLEDMIAAVDTVVVATPVGSVKGRDVVGNEEGDTGFHATIFVEVEEIVAGRVVEGDGLELKVEAFLGAAYPSEYDYADEYERYASSIPAERALLFLMNKGRFFERAGLDPTQAGAGYDYYFLASGQAYVREVNGLAEPWADGPEWLTRLRGEDFDEVVREVGELATGT